MAAPTLSKQIALDDRLVLGNSTQIVEVGAMQNLQRKFPSTQANNQSIQWNNILSLGQNAVLDPRFVVEYDAVVTFDVGQFQIPPGVLVTYAGAASTGVAIADPTPYIQKLNTTQCNVPNICFAQFPLSRVTPNAALMINSVETTVNLQNYLAINRECIVDADQRNEMYSTCPSFCDVAPVMADQVILASALAANPLEFTSFGLIPNQPNTPFYASQGKSRASILPISVVQVGNAGTLYKATYRFREPVLISPCTLQSSAALANVQSIALKYNLDASNNLLGMLTCANQYVNTVTVAGGGAIQLSTTNLSVSIGSQAELYIDVLSVDEAYQGRIPEITYYDYSYLELNNTPVGLPAAIATLSNPTTNTNGYKLTTMPKYYAMRIMPQLNGTAPTNTLAGLPITQITFQLGSLGNYTLEEEQLFQCWQNNSKRNDINYAQWVAMGTPILINPSIDLSSSNGIFQGVTQTGGIMFSATVTYNNNNYKQTGAANYSQLLGAGAATAAQFYIYEAFVQVGSCAIGQGSCSYRSTTMSENEFLTASDAGMVSSNAVKSSQGVKAGSLFGSLRGIFNGAHSVLKTGAQALQHPLVQKGLSALAGSGMSGGGVSGGDITYSTRRRK
jgi:hypothetical protein